MKQQMSAMYFVTIVFLLCSVMITASKKKASDVDKAFQKLFAAAKPEDPENPGADFVTKLLVTKSATAAAGTPASSKSRVSPATPGAPAAAKVPVEVYYEALCPYCQAFMGGALTDVINKADMAAIIDLKLVPYGNTHMDSGGTYHCQHGVGECMSDVIMQCTLYKLGGSMAAIGDGSQSFAAWPFIRQLVVEEKGHPVKAEDSFKSTLGKSSKLTWVEVIDCYKNEADAVQQASAAATPPHQYTAWIVVNHEHLEDGNALESAICNAYEGVKPQSCASATSLSVTKKQSRKSAGKWGSSFVWTEEEKKASALSEKMAEKKDYKMKKK